MRGNVYISLNESTYEGSIPTELVNKYGVPVLDDEGVETGKTTPTFKELGEVNKHLFGRVITVIVNSENYYVMELDASWSSSEVSALLNLGSGLSSPNNTLMTNKEAINFINENAPEEE
tara:strand:+ start:353 stop:709 length:357 start_codon:yes stop_codon:yes gene_type:complete